jgi:phosphonate transport system substrate-binding protein
MLNKKILLILILLLLPAYSVFFAVYAQSNKNSSTKRVYTVGYMKNLFNQVDLNDAKAAIKVWLDELVKTYHYTEGYSLKVKIYNQFDEINKEMRHDSLAILSMNATDYLNNFAKIGLDPVLVPSIGGDIFTQYFLLVKKESRYKNIKDLKGTSLGILSGTIQADSKCWLDVTLAKNNIHDKSKFFKNIILSNTESQLILNLFFGRLDACIVSKSAFSVIKELNPQVEQKIVSIQTSPKYLCGLFCFTKTFVNQNDRNLFYTNAVNIQKLVSGRQVLSLVKVNKLEPFKLEYLNSLRDLLKDYNNLLSTKMIREDELN